MGAHSPSWRPDYSPALMRRELDIIQADLHASAVRLGGRDPRRLLDAASYAASIGLNVWLGPELWNATPRQTLRFVTDAAAAAEPPDLLRRQRAHHVHARHRQLLRSPVRARRLGPL